MSRRGRARQVRGGGHMKLCDSCRYSFRADVSGDGQMLTACVYILRTGTRRPCPYGEGCAVYRPRERETEKKGWCEGR